MQHRGHAAKLAAFEANVGLLEVGRLAVGKVVADFADEIDVVVNVSAQEAHAIDNVGTGAEGLQWPAGANEPIDGL